MSATSEIRVLSEQEYGSFIRLQGVAYPSSGLVTAEARQKASERMIKAHANDPRMVAYGLFRDNVMVGAMTLHDFDMTLLSSRVLCGGVGSVAVDLTHKKEHVAFEMLSYYIQHYRDKKAPVAALYPFRPDFYRKMGFGYCTRIHQYRVKPASLPRGGSQKHVCYLTKDDVPELLGFHNRMAARTNGMMQAVSSEFLSPLEGDFLAVAYRDADGIRGYMMFRFRKGKDDSPLQNDIVIRQMICERDALPELLTFLNVQADQIDNVVFNWQDDHFYLLPQDPRNGSNHLLAPVYHETSAEGVGLMLRVLDVKQLFEALKDHDFGGVTALVRFSIRDTLVAKNAGTIVVGFAEGLPTVLENDRHHCDAEVSMDIAEFSSLIVGAVDFRSLYNLRLAEISDESQVSLVNRIFHTEMRPKCTTMF